jgi:hypothetical protein
LSASWDVLAAISRTTRPSSTRNAIRHGESGLLLTPSIDHLFGRGFIGFEGNGNVIISPVAHRPSLDRMGIEVRDTLNVGPFTAAQRHFLEYHRDMVLLKAAR